MSHIFISYSKKNRDYARALADKLLDAGFDVWIDDRIDYGDDWWQVIVKAIRECGAFLIIMTPESDTSKWVQREVALADHLPKPMFPVLRSGDLINSETWTIFIRTQYANVLDGSLPKDDFYVRLRRVVAPKASRGADVTAPELLTPPQPVTPVGTMPASSDIRIPASSAESKPVTAPPLRSERGLGGEAALSLIIPQPFKWCVVPAGKVTLTDVDNGYLKEATTFDVPEFQIARYPITNAQFEVFVTAKDGWRNAEWWDYSDASNIQRINNLESKPASFKDCADCPRERVTWYAAVAFTRWLSAKTSVSITLPTEQQWQRAAQGDDGREYPWGNEWDARKCNTDESKIGKTTPVTQYPQGASPYGVLDMSGNVWEWCLTDWETGEVDLNGTNVRVLRGGSWFSDPQLARAAYRNRYVPYVRYDLAGFRVVCGSVPI